MSKKEKSITVYEVFVAGIPKPQPRPRLSKQGHAYTSHTADAWKAAVKAEFMCRLKPKIGIPVYLTVRFYPPRPKRAKPAAPSPTVPQPPAVSRASRRAPNNDCQLTIRL